ncbi:MAG TPA: hypothetical protein VHE33_02325 [Acidobacteriaceae bacterium]|nr:hypothetical protein [Acidobacteriaceae bacterium]
MLLASNQILKVGLLRRAALQEQKEVKGLFIFHQTKIWCAKNVLANIPTEKRGDFVVDRLHQT